MDYKEKLADFKNPIEDGIYHSKLALHKVEIGWNQIIKADF